METVVVVSCKVVVVVVGLAVEMLVVLKDGVTIVVEVVIVGKGVGEVFVV